MKNVLAILKRDFCRLIKAPSALVVVLALLIIPSLYTWYNVLGFWDPYGNTSNIRVSVVNLDEGGETDLTGELNVGDKIIDALEENDQLDWVFEDYDTAYENLLSGTNFAVFVIPEDFTEDMLTITTGTFEQPTMQYYVNMKTGPVGPKITDTGSTTLEETINETFVKTVSEIAINALEDSAASTQSFLDENTSQALKVINESIESLQNTQDNLNAIDSSLSQAQNSRSIAISAIDDAKGAINATSQSLNDVSAQTAKVQEVLLDVTPAAMAAVHTAITELAKLEGIAEETGTLEELKAAEKVLEACSSSLFDTALPAITEEMGSLSASTAELSVAVSNQKSLIEQTKVVLYNLNSVLDTARTSIQQTNTLLVNAETRLTQVRDDFLSLAGSETLTSLIEESNIDEEAVAQFISSPSTVVTERLYAPNAYGAAMAPLFMNLTFWIGAFMLMVIMRKEADSKGIENLTFAQRYIGRFLMFALFAVLQAIICCAGLLAIGVEAANAPALFLGAAVASLAYLSIIYAFSVTLQHVGMGVCVILVFIQIPAATGLYPIEMMADFYQAISPFFPFTYGISIMREAICGFYGNTFLRDLGVLFCFFAAFLILGIALRPLLANVNRTFAKQLQESDILNVDEIVIPHQHFRTAQLLRTLSQDESYRVHMHARYQWFEHNHKKLISIIALLAVLVPALISLIVSMTVNDKVVLLTLWLCWIVFLFVLLSFIENMRSNLRQEFATENAPAMSVQEMWRSRHYVDSSSSSVKKCPEADASEEVEQESEASSETEVSPESDGLSEQDASTEPDALLEHVTSAESDASPESDASQESATQDAANQQDEGATQEDDSSPDTAASHAEVTQQGPESAGEENA